MDTFAEAREQDVLNLAEEMDQNVAWWGFTRTPAKYIFRGVPVFHIKVAKEIELPAGD